jgi:hypothetical protein
LGAAGSEEDAGIAILYMIKQKDGKGFLDELKTLLGRSSTTGMHRQSQISKYRLTSCSRCKSMPTILEELEAERARHGKTADDISGLSAAAHQEAWEAELSRHEEWIRDWHRRKALLNVQSLSLSAPVPHSNDPVPSPNGHAMRPSPREG